MTFMKGNKAALGLTNSGRPNKYDVEDYAKKLIEWSKEDKSVNLMQFCAKYSLAAEYISVWSKQSTEFSQALMETKARLCARQSELVQKGKYEWRDYNRQLGYYNKLINEFDREELAYEYGLKKNLETKDININIKAIDYSKTSNGS